MHFQLPASSLLHHLLCSKDRGHVPPTTTVPHNARKQAPTAQGLMDRAPCPDASLRVASSNPRGITSVRWGQRQALVGRSSASRWLLRLGFCGCTEVARAKVSCTNPPWPLFFSLVCIGTSPSRQPRPPICHFVLRRHPPPRGHFSACPQRWVMGALARERCWQPHCALPLPHSSLTHPLAVGGWRERTREHPQRCTGGVSHEVRALFAMTGSLPVPVPVHSGSGLTLLSHHAEQLGLG